MNIGFHTAHGDNEGYVAGKMKTTVLLVCSLLVVLATVQGQNTSNETVSSDAAVDLGVDLLQEFENGKLPCFFFFSHFFSCYTASVLFKMCFLEALIDTRTLKKNVSVLLRAQRSSRHKNCRMGGLIINVHEIRLQTVFYPGFSQ